MSKIQVVKAVAKSLADICRQDGFELIGYKSSDIVIKFLRSEESYFCKFHYSFSGRGAYSADGHIDIIYKALSCIMYALLKGTPYEEDYNFDNIPSRYIGVGISSEIGRHARRETTLYIDSVDDADSFAMELYGRVKEEEQKFILPAVNIENTIAGFMKKLYYFWPGPPICFIEHLVSYGILTSNADLIHYAFTKGDEVSLKGPEHVRLREIAFINTVKEKVAEQHPELWKP
jgi:hypothetical protein